MSLAIRNEISNSIFYDTLNLFYAHRTKGGEEARVLRVTVLVLNYGNDQIFECSSIREALPSFVASIEGDEAKKLKGLKSLK